MICSACGCQQINGVSFCKACGALLASPPPNSGPQPWMPLTGGPASQNPYIVSGGRVRQNLQPVGIAWCLWGVYRFVMGLVAGFAVHAMAHHHMWFSDGSDFIPSFLGAFVPILAVSTVVMSSLALVTGWSLLTAKSWGRTLAIIVAILTLIKIPLGTALGIYSLWVLAPRLSGLEYAGLAASAGTQP